MSDDTYPHRLHSQLRRTAYCLCGDTRGFALGHRPTEWGRDCPAALREALATAERERESLYADGDAAGDRARMARCRQDMARALGLRADTPAHAPDWIVIFGAVRDQKAERDTLAARVAELEAHGGSLHKATAAGRDAERAAVVAWLRRPEICGPYGLTGIADAIARGEHLTDAPRWPLMTTAVVDGLGVVEAAVGVEHLTGDDDR